MSERISKIEHGLLLALASSLRSEDPHTKVGCALENHHGRITVVGYNGLKEKQSLSFDANADRDRKKFHFIHAETNALSLIKRGEIKTIYLTYSPCVACCQNIGANEIQKVVFLYEYTPEYKEVLDSYGIEYVHYTKIEHPVLKYMMELDELKRVPREIPEENLPVCRCSVCSNGNPWSIDESSPVFCLIDKSNHPSSHCCKSFQRVTSEEIKEWKKRRYGGLQ